MIQSNGLVLTIMVDYFLHELNDLKVSQLYITGDAFTQPCIYVHIGIIKMFSIFILSLSLVFNWYALALGVFKCDV